MTNNWSQYTLYKLILFSRSLWGSSNHINTHITVTRPQQSIKTNQSSCQGVCTCVLLKVWITYEGASNLLSGTGNSKVTSEGGHVAHQNSGKRVPKVLIKDPGLLCQPSSNLLLIRLKSHSCSRALESSFSAYWNHPFAHTSVLTYTWIQFIPPLFVGQCYFTNPCISSVVHESIECSSSNDWKCVFNWLKIHIYFNWNWLYVKALWCASLLVHCFWGWASWHYVFKHIWVT